MKLFAFIVVKTFLQILILALQLYQSDKSDT